MSDGRPKIGRDVPASMIAGVMTGFVVTPFDVVTRRVQKGDFATPRKALFSLIRNEGTSSLFRGLAPTLVMFASTNAMYFPVYEQLRSELNRRSPSHFTPMIAGSIARAFVVCLSSPLEYVRTNMQSNSATSHSGGGGVFVVLQRILNSGGRNLFSGLVPTLWRDVPHSALYWMLVEMIRGRFGEKNRSDQSFSVVFGAGAVAGSVAAAATTPFDVIKTQMQHSVDGRKEGVKQVAMRVLRSEGWRGLFRGIVPRVSKITPASAVMLSCFEFLRKE